MPRRGNLSPPATSLVGRAFEVAEVVELARAHRLVTLTGVGGVGKTRLALDAGASLADEFPDGVWLVELAPVADADSVPDVFATALGITPRAGVPITQTLAEALAGRRLLVLLDNCEHVVEAAAATVEVILARSDTVTVLATSREGLGAVGEHLVPVPPMPLDGGAASAAVALFVARARAVDPTFALDDGATADAVTEICRGLDGLALGIELAAAWTVSLTPVDLQQRLVANRFRLLTGSKHQRSLRETVAWSYELLDDEERAVLMHASVFAGGFDVDGIAEVVGIDDPIDVLDHLHSLVRKSLVVTSRVAGTVRYSLLETIRQFAEYELAEIGDLDRDRDRHGAYFARVVTARWDEWNGPGFHDAVGWVTTEFANLRAAFRWSAAQGDAQTAADIAAHSAMIGVSTELFEAVGWVNEIIDAATTADVRSSAAPVYRGRLQLLHRTARAGRRPRADRPAPGGGPALRRLRTWLGHVHRGARPGVLRTPRRLPGAHPPGGGSPRIGARPRPARVRRRPPGDGTRRRSARAGGGSGRHRTRLRQRLVDRVRALGARVRVRARRSRPSPRPVARGARRRPPSTGSTSSKGSSRAMPRCSKLADAMPAESIDLFDAAIDSFRRSGNVAQLGITVASVTSLFDRIDAPEAAATLYGAITGAAGGDHHLRDLSDLADHIASCLGPDRFAERVSEGSTLELSSAALYAHEQLQLARERLATRAATPDRPGDLSRREVEVLLLVADGLTTREIADRLYISPKTADHHIQHIYTKIGVSSRAAATLWAFQHGVVV